MMALTLAVGAAMTSSSCGDKNNDPQAPAQVRTATLVGQITPADAVTLVTATDTRGHLYTAAPNSAGVYSFPDLAVGDYTLSYAPAPDYATPAPLQVTLAASVTTASEIRVPIVSPSVSFYANGTLVRPTHLYVSTQGGRRFIFSVSSGATPGPTLSLYLDGRTPAVGTYPLTSSLYGFSASYLAADNQHYFTNGDIDTVPPSGTLVITNVNTNLRRVSGTFEFTGYSTNSAGATVSARITNGVFANMVY